MSPRTLIVPVLLLAAGVAYTQQPPAVAPLGPVQIPPTAVPVVAQPARAATPEVPLSAQTLDQLLDRLEALRAQKAELEKLEQEVLKEVRRKLEKQGDRINRLGITPADPIAPVLPGPSTSFQPPAPVQVIPPTGVPAQPRNP